MFEEAERLPIEQLQPRLGNVLLLLLASGIFIALVVLSSLFTATFRVLRYVAAIGSSQ